MKRIVAIIGLIAVCLALTSCDPGHYWYDYGELESQVILIELIDYDNPDQKSFSSWVPDHFSDLASFDNSKMTVLETLSDDVMPDFLLQLSEVIFLDQYYVFDSPKGVCLKLTYESGNFLILSCDYEHESFCGYIGEYSADGTVIEYTGSFCAYADFKALVNDYFETNI